VTHRVQGGALGDEEQLAAFRRRPGGEPEQQLGADAGGVALAEDEPRRLQGSRSPGGPGRGRRRRSSSSLNM
jgi:hypothetical protein